MKKIIAPIQLNDGCSFFRIETPAQYLEDCVVDLPLYSINKFTPPAKTGFRLIDRVTGSLWDRKKLRERVQVVEQQSNYSAFWLSRSLMSFPNAADRAVTNLIYDVDDAIWLNGEADHCFEHHCKNALVVFAGNSFIADHASKYTSKIEIVPTSVDMEYHVNFSLTKNSFNVGWIGSAAGLYYLSDIAADLLSFFKTHSDARLVIVTERYPKELRGLETYIDYIPWSRDTEIESINKFSVGIMPLRNTEWEKGKCSFKMLQYMACEVPVIVSPVGMNVEVMDVSKSSGKFGEYPLPNWCDVLANFYSLGQSELVRQGHNGRRAAENYSTRTVASKMSDYLQKYV